jgi:tetratricopeptide (TPR) repeat protein
MARPYVPPDDAQVLAEVPAGAHHAELAARRVARGRLDAAIPLAQFYIGQSRSSGDLRYLGYAEAVLAPWVALATPVPAALVLQATIQQSRHEFTVALATLDRSLAARPADPQAWLTRATVLRVMGRYLEAAAACRTFARETDAALGNLCAQSVRGLRGQLEPAYRALGQQPVQGMLGPERAWRASELGEMAVRLGRDREAERWFKEDLGFSPHDAYARAAYADLLLRQQRPGEVLALLKGDDSVEPLLLRIAIAQKLLHDPGLARSRARLEAAFEDEVQRGAAVHRREQARFLLEVEDRPQDALSTALLNWQAQHEPDDVLVLIHAARAAGRPQRAAPALNFIQAQGLQDARLPVELQVGT